MVQIPSITKDETQLAQYLVKTCAKFGIKSRIDKVGNFIAEVGNPNAHPCILLLGHMDTVAPILPVTIDKEN